MRNPHFFQKFCWLCFDFGENDNTFERNEDCATVFLKWTDFSSFCWEWIVFIKALSLWLLFHRFVLYISCSRHKFWRNYESNFYFGTIILRNKKCCQNVDNYKWKIEIDMLWQLKRGLLVVSWFLRILWLEQDNR